MFGKQYHYCANCGKELYDARLSWKRVSLCDTKECRDEFELKYTRLILGESALAKPTPNDKLDKLDKLDKIQKIVDLYFMPWGAAKAAMWQEMAGDGLFGSERGMSLIRDVMNRVSS